MENKDYHKKILTDKSPEEVFNAICNVRDWWSQDFEGSSLNLNDEFSVRFGDVHYSRHRITELEPGERVVWLVIDSELNFLQDKSEWNNTRNIFEISRNGDKTELTFTHEGLVPEIECYTNCSGGWNYYLASLEKILTGGIGNPNKITNNTNQ